VKKKVGYVLVLMWAGSLLTGLWLYSDKQLTAFDPDLRLNTAAANPAFDSQIVTALIKAGVKTPAIVHLNNQNDCFCERLSIPHQVQLNEALPDFTLHTMTIDALPDNLSKLFAMTPAVVVIDAQSRLRYLGPYALGYGCVTGKTLLGTIAEKAQGDYQPAGAVISQAQGCFCDVR
tara:strand:- start:71 stop:598 length:528 start_codon:yes stop_codon:yes gene_type:complete